MVKTDKPDIVIINVMKAGDYQFDQEIPLGVGYLGAFLREHGYEITYIQCFPDRNEAEIDAAATVPATIYAFQLNMVNYQAVKLVVQKIKEKHPDAITLFGGPYLVSHSEEILCNEPLFDFMVMGEGELTVLELLKGIEAKTEDLQHIDGLVWRDKAKRIVRNKSRKAIENLDSLPFPARDFLDDARRDPRDNGLVESLRIVTSRGCVGKCSFCCVNLNRKVQRGKAWRGRSPRNVVDELEYLCKTYKAKLFNFSDSSFEDPGESGKERSREICKEIIRRRIPLSAKIYLRCETMRSDEDIELLKLYKKAGIDVVIIGAESGSDEELRLYEKRASLRDNYRMAQILKDLDMFYVLIGFIMFGPNSTLTTVRDNIEFLHEFGSTDNILFVSNVLMLIRGSKLYDSLKEEGRVIESNKYWELPKYRFLDPLAERLANHWSNLFGRYPVTYEVSKLQINSANLYARMTNPMNTPILAAFQEEFLSFKDQYKKLGRQFGKLQYDYFLQTVDLVRSGCDDEVLHQSADRFFGETYAEYLPEYDQLYNGLLQRVSEGGFSLSGLVFNHFLSFLRVEGDAESKG